MLKLIFCLILAVVLLVTIILQQTFGAVPRKELKRHAKQGDQLASVLYKAVAYGVSLQILLWAIIGLSSAGLFVLLSHTLSGGLTFLVIALLIWFGYAWIPSGTAGPFAGTLTKILAPSLLWVLERLHPLLDALANFVGRYRHINVHTGLYEKEDILDLIERQKTLTDSRITKEELDIAAGALTFGEKLVRGAMVPRKVIKTVKATDTIGPIIMDELHDSGFSRFPVTDGSKAGNIIGTLYLRDLVDIKNGGKVSDIMDHKVYYVNENANLAGVFEAFLKTQHHLFIVVNEFEDMVGVITIEDVLEQIIGKQIVGEFDAYDDLRAVAAHQAEKEKHKHTAENDNVEEIASE